MDFYRSIEGLSPKLKRLIKLINDPSITPALRRSALQSVLSQVGGAIYLKAYDMTAFDMEIRETRGKGIPAAMSQGLAHIVSDSIATGDFNTAFDQAIAFGVTASQLAMGDASTTAGALGKYRTLRINLRGKGDCDWCRAKAARGAIVNPTDDDFRRHGGCDCFYDVQGYKSRNGEVKNYRPV